MGSTEKDVKVVGRAEFYEATHNWVAIKISRIL